MTDDLISGSHFALKYQQGQFIYLTHLQLAYNVPQYQHNVPHTFTAGLSANNLLAATLGRLAQNTKGKPSVTHLFVKSHSSANECRGTRNYAPKPKKAIFSSSVVVAHIISLATW